MGLTGSKAVNPLKIEVINILVSGSSNFEKSISKKSEQINWTRKSLKANKYSEFSVWKSKTRRASFLIAKRADIWSSIVFDECVKCLFKSDVINGRNSEPKKDKLTKDDEYPIALKIAVKSSSLIS